MIPARMAVAAALAASLFLISVSPAQAAGGAEFSRGVAAFKRGDLDQAVKLFERAYQAGMHTPALLYNLGVSYYRLGNYEQARRYFRRLTRNPSMAPLARYNLAIIADRQGRRAEAESGLRTVLQSSHDDKLLYLARKKLDELRSGKGIWHGFLATYAGYDDNVTVAPTGTAGGPDGYLSLSGYIQNLVAGKRDDGLLVSGGLFTRQYASLAGYNQNGVRLGVRRLTSLGSAPWSYGAYLGTSTFGGSPFETVLGLQTQLRRSTGKYSELRTRYRLQAIQSLNPVYNYLQGWLQQIRFEERLSQGLQKLRLIYEFETNERQDQATASFSPMRNTLRAIYELRGKQWSMAAELGYRRSDFPIVATQNRHDDRFRFLFVVGRQVGHHGKIQLRYWHIDNRSTDALYQYASNRAELGYAWFF